MKHLLIFLIFCSPIYALDFSDLDSAVLIFAKSNEKDEKGGTVFDKGSGVVICQDANWTYILTADHCVQGYDIMVVFSHPVEQISGPNVKILFKTGTKNFDYNAPDIAILQVKNTRKIKAAQITSQIPARLFALGYTENEMTPSAHPVLLEAITDLWVKVGPGIHQGLSGGPLVTNDGKIAAIIIAQSADQNHGISLRIDAVKPLLDAKVLEALKLAGAPL